MVKQSSCRNQRSRRFKVKRVIQICLLISICVWLLYQAIHPHDTYEERLAKISIKVQESGRGGTIKLGRKDIDDEKESKAEEVEDKGRGVGDEDTDENDEEEAEEAEEDLIDVDDKENEEGNERQDKSSHIEHKGLLEGQSQRIARNSTTGSLF